VLSEHVYMKRAGLSHPYLIVGYSLVCIQKIKRVGGDFCSRLQRTVDGRKPSKA